MKLQTGKEFLLTGLSTISARLRGIRGRQHPAECTRASGGRVLGQRLDYNAGGPGTRSPRPVGPAAPRGRSGCRNLEF